MLLACAETYAEGCFEGGIVSCGVTALVGFIVSDLRLATNVLADFSFSDNLFESWSVPSAPDFIGVGTLSCMKDTFSCTGWISVTAFLKAFILL